MIKIAEYKGYNIEFHEAIGEFYIDNVKGTFATYAATKTKIDRLVKSEVKGKFPIEVVTRSFGTGSITSYNSEDKQAWSTINGRRGKDNMVDYAGEPRFYAANENNLQLLGQYNDLQSQLAELNKRCRELEKRLTEPITFEP